MKKVIYLSLIIFQLLVFTGNVNAFKVFKQGNYFENYQWGALEAILSDWRSGNITTDECALFGCYVLAAQEPSRADRNSKKKLMPAKYNINNKSKEKGPYFFVYFLYNNESILGSEALAEYRNSDWCEDEFVKEIVCNDKVEKLLNDASSKINVDAIRKRGNNIDFWDVLIDLAEADIISYESVCIASMMHLNNYDKFDNKFNAFVKKLSFKKVPGRFALIANLCERCKDTNNRKAINMFNFHYNYWELKKRNDNYHR